jgi:hypothetical protein
LCRGPQAPPDPDTLPAVLCGVIMFVILTQSGGVAAAFHTESEALQTIRTAHDAHGHAYAARYQLVAEDGRGTATPIASGVELVERALAAAM